MIPTLAKILSQISDEDKTPLVLQLLEVLQLQNETIQGLKDEIARLKGEKPKPDIKPSKLEKPITKDGPGLLAASEKRPGSAKKEKTKLLEIHREEIICPVFIPEGAKFKGYQDYVVQDIVIKTHNIRYRLERWECPDGKSVVGKLPAELQGSHFGVDLTRFILYQYYQAHVTQPLILEELLEIGVDISAGQLNRILIENKEIFHTEKEEILKVGLEVSKYINVDDTGARHNGKNGYCTHIGNEMFAFFESTESKSRINFLQILRAGRNDYIITPEALGYMKQQNLPLSEIKKFASLLNSVFPSEASWQDQLSKFGITNKRHVHILTEGVLMGSVLEHGFNPNMIIISDDAGQFNIFLHGLCWMHAERTINKLVGFNEEQIAALNQKRDEIWQFYDDLKKYKKNPDISEKKRLKEVFKKIFTEKTCFASLNQALGRIFKNVDELLLVLTYPEIPLHNNLSENDIREYVKRRKISGSTRSSPGRRCRDTFTSLKKTCRKLGISFWDYLKNRLVDKGGGVPYLPSLIRIQACGAER